MAFISNRQKEGIVIGGKLRLTRNVEVMKGIFTKNSVVEVLGVPHREDYRGEFLVRDVESGEELYLSTILGGYTKV